MRSSSRRRRAILMLALAVAVGGFAAAGVESRVSEVESRVGAPLPVVVAAEGIPAGERFAPGNVDRVLVVRQVPERFVPPGSLTAAEEALGLRAAVPIPAGGYVTAGDLETGSGGGGAGAAVAPGERIVEVTVAGAAGADAAGPEARVDVVVTTGAETGGGRTYVALQRVQLVDLRMAGGARPAGGGAGPSAAVAALRVTLDQAVMLTAAQNFAREIRLLTRAPGDRRRVGPTSVNAADL